MVKEKKVEKKKRKKRNKTRKKEMDPLTREMKGGRCVQQRLLTETVSAGFCPSDQCFKIRKRVPFT